MPGPSIYDQEWREASRLVLADFRGLLAFRQFRLGSVFGPPSGSIGSHPKYEDDFTISSVFSRYNWLPRDNVAQCNANNEVHTIPGRACTCGFYASYSSSIVYHPEMLGKLDHCFGAVRMYGEDLPMAQNGLRSSGAEVAGLLFSPASLRLSILQDFLLRLKKEGIFYTDSAEKFVKQFPDQDYTDIIGFDPVKRIGNLEVKMQEFKSSSADPERWLSADYTLKYCRPLRREMLQRVEVDPKEAAEYTAHYLVSLKPEYRPGGALYRHPLIEEWSR